MCSNAAGNIYETYSATNEKRGGGTKRCDDSGQAKLGSTTTSVGNGAPAPQLAATAHAPNEQGNEDGHGEQAHKRQKSDKVPAHAATQQDTTKTRGKGNVENVAAESLPAQGKRPEPEPRPAQPKNIVQTALAMKKNYQQIAGQAKQTLENIESDAAWYWAKEGADHKDLLKLSENLQKTSPFTKQFLSLDVKLLRSQYKADDLKSHCTSFVHEHSQTLDEIDSLLSRIQQMHGCHLKAILSRKGNLPRAASPQHAK